VKPRLVDAKAVVMSHTSVCLAAGTEDVLWVSMGALMFDGLESLEGPPRSLFLLIPSLAESDLGDGMSAGLDGEPDPGVDDKSDPGLDGDLGSDLDGDMATGFRDDSQVETSLVLETGLPSLSGCANEVEGPLSSWVPLVAEWPIAGLDDPKRPPLT